MNRKVIIVTGGAKGIGEELVKQLALENNVILNYKTSEKEALIIQKKLKENKINIDIFKADLSKRNEVLELINFVINKYHNIDVLINNAGIDQIKMFIDITDEDWENMIKNNLNSVYYTCQESLKYMIEKQEGLIINISSIWGITGASCESHYSATKAGIDALTKSLAKEMGPSNIRVNSIAPGIIETDMINNLSEAEKKDIINEIPLKKIGTPNDIAKCVKWLIEDKYVTGQIISINGGWLI